MERALMAVRGGKTLTIFLAADLKKFNQGTAQAQTGLKGLAGTMKNLLGPAAIGAGIAIAGLATKMAVDSSAYPLTSRRLTIPAHKKP
jgi:hypothetical protein